MRLKILAFFLFLIPAAAADHGGARSRVKSLTAGRQLRWSYSQRSLKQSTLSSRWLFFPLRCRLIIAHQRFNPESWMIVPQLF
jgi:hypothetical protein